MARGKHAASSANRRATAESARIAELEGELRDLRREHVTVSERNEVVEKDLVRLRALVDGNTSELLEKERAQAGRLLSAVQDELGTARDLLNRIGVVVAESGSDVLEGTHPGEFFEALGTVDGIGDLLAAFSVNSRDKVRRLRGGRTAAHRGELKSQDNLRTRSESRSA